MTVIPLRQAQDPASVPRPKHIFMLHFDIVRGCQLRCVGCPTPVIEPKVQRISVEDWAKCLANIDVERVNILRLYRSGEPLLHKQLAAIVAEIPKQRWRASVVEISTNGQWVDWGQLRGGDAPGGRQQARGELRRRRHAGGLRAAAPALQAKGGQTISVCIRGPLPDIKARLSAMSKVREIAVLGEENGFNRLSLSTDGTTNMCEEIFFMVAQNCWSLSELYRGTITLEDVFRELTTGEA